MKIEFLQQRGASRLILIFAGWAMDANPFKTLEHQAYDIAVAYDYRDLHLPQHISLSEYNEICILAWSFGVPSAHAFLINHDELPVTARVAVNGTLTPVDDRFGIPCAIFQGTLNSISPASLSRFNRRMCGSATAAKEYDRHAPQREISELADELRAIAKRSTDQNKEHWDTIYISESDLIIPTANQKAAWGKHTDIRTIEGPHLPNFQRIISERFINKQLVATRFSKALQTYNENASVQAETALRLIEMIGQRNPPQPTAALEIGTGTGMLTHLLVNKLRPRDITLWDISDIPETLPGTHLTCDAEVEIKHADAETFQLIASSSTIQWFNSPIDFIRHAHRTLKPGGMLAFSTFAPENFNEISHILPTKLHYHSAAEWNTILTEAGFRDIKIEHRTKTLQFNSPDELLRHLKQTGVNATTPSFAAAKKTLSSGITTLTYHPLIITATK